MEEELEGVCPDMIKIENQVGRISITDEVFMNLAGEAATGCFGVKGMVACSKESGRWQLLRRESMSKGVKVETYEDGSLSLELHIGVDRDVPMCTIAGSIINEVSYKLGKSTGVPLRSVDVFVDAIIS